MINQEDLNYYIKFAQDVFTLFNGRVNQINKGVMLSITPVSSNLFGSIRYNYILELFIFECIRYNDTVTKNNILHTIIHELFHADQPIDYREYQNYSRYENMVESRVEYQSAIYILDNIKFIEDNLDIKVNLDKFNVLKQQYQQYNDYRRISIYEFYIYKFNWFFSGYVLNNYLMNFSNIILSKSDDEFIVKKNGEFNSDTNLFNEFLYRITDNHSANRMKLIISKEGNTLTIEIEKILDNARRCFTIEEEK